MVLDTHVWLWWVSNPERLSGRARRAITQAIDKNQPVYVSSISAWEVCLLSRRGRLELRIEAQDWIAKCEAIPYFHFVPVDNLIAVKAVLLPPPLQQDPADRIITATALTLGVPVVTKDQRIRRYRPVKSIW